MEYDQERLAKALAALGDSPNKVCDTLVAQGIRGERYASQECPIAMYLQAEMGQPYSVTSVAARAAGNNAYPATRLPGAVSTFIEDFDAGRHSELDVAPDERNAWGG